MNRRRRLLSLVLVLAYVVCVFITNVSAETPSSGDDVDYGTPLTQLEVSAAITQYFSDRAAFLKDPSITTFSSAIADMIPDETLHRSVLNEQQITFESSTITINILSCQLIAKASVLEEVTYTLNGATYTETVWHDLVIIRGDSNQIQISNDVYIEEYSGFQSCAYIDPAATVVTYAAAGTGSRSCLIYIATQEIGYSPAVDNQTKYHTWYESYSGDDYSGQPWCAIFVSWCAANANVSSSVIPRYAYVPYYYNNLTYYSRSSTTPQVGDLAIWTGKTHIGIVSSVNSSAGTYTVIEGNSNDGTLSVDGVIQSTWSFSSTAIMGFCRPAYTVTNHSYTWPYNATQHWGVCDHCGYTTSKSAHTFSNSVCVTCGCPDDANAVNGTPAHLVCE